jgi:hypothetical protein
MPRVSSPSPPTTRPPSRTSVFRVPSSVSSSAVGVRSASGLARPTCPEWSPASPSSSSSSLPSLSACSSERRLSLPLAGPSSVSPFPSDLPRLQLTLRHPLCRLRRRDLPHSAPRCRCFLHLHVLGYGWFHRFRWCVSVNCSRWRSADPAVNRGALSIPGDWGWRMAYMVQWVWPVPLLIGTYFAPESESTFCPITI